MSSTTRSKGISKIIILALVLIVPGFLYLLMENLGKHEYVKLPIYGDKVLTGETKRVMGREIPDTVYHQLSPLEFTNWDGSKVDFLKTDSVISIVHLCYSSDSSFSNIMFDYMDKLATKFMNQSSVRFYSISVDPNEKPENLTYVNERYGGDLNRRKWSLLSQSSTDLLVYAPNEMLLDAMRDIRDSSRFIISDQFILIDTERRIRGFYSVSLHSEIKRLEDEIKVQMVEEVRNKPMKVEKVKN